MSGFVCPCGCALQLSPRDLAAARWIEQLAGDPSGRRVNLKMPKRSVEAVAEAREPTRSVRCRSCKSEYRLPVYLVEFLAAYSVPAPHCEPCIRAAA